MSESSPAPLEELRALEDRINAALAAVAAPLDQESARRILALAALTSIDLRPDSRPPDWQQVQLLPGTPPLWLYWLAERSLIHFFLRWGEPFEGTLPRDPGLAWDALEAAIGARGLTTFSARHATLHAWAQTSREELEEDEPEMFCSLCGKSQFELEKLVGGQEIFACDQCIASCAEELARSGSLLERPASACAFCGKEPSAISRFVRRAGFELCGECVALCAEFTEPGVDDSAREGS